MTETGNSIAAAIASWVPEVLVDGRWRPTATRTIS
jgi:hypothetical protein